MRVTGGRLARDSVWMISVQVFGRGLTLLFSLYAASALGVEKFGVYGYAMAIITLIASFADFGSNTYQVRQTAVLPYELEKRRLLTSALSLRTTLSIIGYVILLIVVKILNRDETTSTLILLLGAGMFFNNIASGFTQSLVGLENFKLYGWIATASQALNVGAACLLIYAGYGLLGIGYAYSIWAFISFIAITFLFVFRHYAPAFRFSGKELKSFFLGALPIGLTVILVSIYYKSDYIILGYFKGSIEVGYYNAAYVIVNAMIFIPATISTTVLPRLANFFGKEDENLEILYQKVFKYLFFAGFGLAFGTMAVSSKLIASIYPGEFAISFKALNILIWALALIFFNSIQGNMLVAIGKQNYLVYVTGAAAIINVGLNFLAIPRYGMQGAASTTVLAEIVAGISCLYILRDYNGVVNVLPTIIRTIVAGVSMYTMLLIIGDITLFVKIPFGIFIYFIVLYAIGGLAKSDIQTVKDIFRRG